MKKLIFECIAILAASAVVGLMVNAVRPDGLPLIGNWSEESKSTEESEKITLINIDQAHDMWLNTDALFIDARTPSEYAVDRIPGAINLPRGNPQGYFDRLKPQIDNAPQIVVYCSSKDCDDSGIIGDFLIKHGYTNLYLFEGGIIAWDMNGYPLEQ